jgi:hypothetical protein
MSFGRNPDANPDALIQLVTRPAVKGETRREKGRGRGRPRNRDRDAGGDKMGTFGVQGGKSQRGDAEVDRASRLGAFDYVLKPFDPARVVDAARRATGLDPIGHSAEAR